MSGTYYPSAKLRLRVRLDEVDQDTSLTLPQVPITNRSSRQDVLNAITKLRYRDIGGGRLLLEPITTGELRATTAEGDVSGDNFTHLISSIEPRSVSIERNGIRSADTFKATIPFQDAPFDPRLVRACGVEVYLGAIPAGDFADGVTRLRKRPGGELVSICPDIDERGRSNRRLIGFIDEWNADWPAEEQSAITIEGRDLTAILMDANLPSVYRANLSIPLTEVFAELMCTLPATQGMTVEMRPSGTEPPNIGAAAARVATPRRGRSSAGAGAGPRRAPQGDSKKTSYWDYMTDLAGAAGFICYVEDTAVVIQTPRTLYGTAFARRENDVFPGRTVEGTSYPVRTFIYGRNVMSLSGGRKFGAKKVPSIEVRCYDTQDKVTRVARFPPAPRLTETPPGDGGGDEKIEVIRVAGIRDEAVLRRIAQSYFEQMGRNNISFKIETRDLASFGGDNEDPDLLDMRSGDAVEILFSRQEQFDTITRLRAMDAPGRASYLERLGFTREFAQVYARLFDSSGFQSIFRVKDATFDWSKDDGLRVTTGAINYMTIREETAELPAGEEPAQPTPTEARQAQSFEDAVDSTDPVRTHTTPEGNDPIYPLPLDTESNL